MTPLERLLAEDIPTRPQPPAPRSTWTAAQQLQHRTDLLEALDGWVWNEDERAEERRHLRLVRRGQAA